MKSAKEIGGRAGEGGAYGNLGNAYQSLGDSGKAIEYHEKRLKIAKEIGNRAGEGRAYRNSVMLTSYWVTIEKRLSMMKNVSKLQKKWVIGPEKWVLLSSFWKTTEKRRSKILSQDWKCILFY